MMEIWKHVFLLYALKYEFSITLRILAVWEIEKNKKVLKFNIDTTVISSKHKNQSSNEFYSLLL